jgi:SDR family mycofactocin-dependent oxidoreductase
MGRVEGKVALITGAARGMGQSHAVRLAEEGADILALDLCKEVDTVGYGLATPDELTETVGKVEALGRQIVARAADVRDYAALKAAVDDGVGTLGRLDIVCANAGISSFGNLDVLEEQAWRDVLDVNLTGAWHTAKAGIPHLRAAGGGSIIVTSSTAGLMGMPGIGHYSASKHGVIGLVRSLALELAPEMIRVNSVNPTSVNTTMMVNELTFARFAPDLSKEERTLDEMKKRFASANAMPIPWVEPVDVSNAVLWLASDEARYVTGVALPIDAGSSAGIIPPHD